MEFGKRMEHLNKSIKKSLIDKNTESFIYNPQLIVNQKVKGIKDAVTYNLSKCSRVDIAVSYVVWSGLSLIKDNLLPLKANSRMLLTTEGYVTDP